MECKGLMIVEGQLILCCLPEKGESSKEVLKRAGFKIDQTDKPDILESDLKSVRYLGLSKNDFFDYLELLGVNLDCLKALKKTMEPEGRKLLEYKLKNEAFEQNELKKKMEFIKVLFSKHSSEKSLIQTFLDYLKLWDFNIKQYPTEKIKRLYLTAKEPARKFLEFLRLMNIEIALKENVLTVKQTNTPILIINEEEFLKFRCDLSKGLNQNERMSIEYYRIDSYKILTYLNNQTNLQMKPMQLATDEAYKQTVPQNQNPLFEEKKKEAKEILFNEQKNDPLELTLPRGDKALQQALQQEQEQQNNLFATVKRGQKPLNPKSKPQTSLPSSDEEQPTFQNKYIRKPSEINQQNFFSKQSKIKPQQSQDDFFVSSNEKKQNPTSPLKKNKN